MSRGYRAGIMGFSSLSLCLVQPFGASKVSSVSLCILQPFGAIVQAVRTIEVFHCDSSAFWGIGSVSLFIIQTLGAIKECYV